MAGVCCVCGAWLALRGVALRVDVRPSLALTRASSALLRKADLINAQDVAPTACGSAAADAAAAAKFNS
jgi:hypothetical protein